MSVQVYHSGKSSGSPTTDVFSSGGD